VDPLALLDRRAHHAERRAVVHGRERARIAVGQDVGAFGHDRRTERAHPPVDFDIFVRDVLRLRDDGRAQVVGIGEDVVPRKVHDARGRPAQVDRGGPGRIEHGLGLGQVDEQAVAVMGRALQRGQRHAEPARRTDGRRAADDHVGDGLRDGAVIGV